MAEVGFIGLGSQGAPIAMRMMAGNALTVWARRPEALAPFAAKGAKAATSVAELGAACDHVGVCVVNDADVVEVCDRLLPTMRPGTLLAIHSTILPQTCEALAVKAAERGVLLLDAPVSGGSPAAEAGTLTVMCGGSEEAFAKALPVLQTFGAKIVLLGPPGAGQRAKIVNNALLAANMGLAHAALEIAEGIGVDRAALADLINHSSGRSFGFEVYARLPSPPAFAHGAGLLFKDVNLLGAIAQPGNALAAAAMPFLDATGVTTEKP
ncbi:NAD(P)-dependent oxidoreductase [Novosphingobium sp. fls2-241-R2A-195]|uniref:NAD(P)-dependent oxidoreductase n=1 Tax=Novosphingobium sp. fls2-241-R2A-195 TaxID=3040296 RepID=UPI00254E89D4|nr:NAD(P)-dependent oxidoreductase [Novosphingobium sp. fls2-241-R2A-195]